MKNILLCASLMLFVFIGYSQSNIDVSQTNNGGHQLLVNGQPFIVNGMNWDYIPRGTNAVNANLFNNSEEVIKAGLDAEMLLLKNMGVNTIRQYTGVPAKWIKYIYEEHGIYTMLNHSFGRYGLTINGVWTPVTDYSDSITQQILMSEVRELVNEYKDTPGILIWLLGNENNYGLFWQGNETEDFPDEESQRNYIGETRGRPMYRLMNDASKMIKSIDSSRPVAICNGDVLFLDIVSEECPDVDIYGSNVYRGSSFGDMFNVVKEKYGKPILLTEFGADAYNAIDLQEDQFSQAFYMTSQWKEIYENTSGLGKAGNSIGGFTFQFSDGWWKYGFDDRAGADEHDNNASWSNGGYQRDFVAGQNNMNEEWFGICAKGPTNQSGLYTLYPRAAYYALKQAHMLNPYIDGMTAQKVNQHFNGIQIMDAVLKARGDKAIATGGSENKALSISSLRANLSSFNTGGSLITTPDIADPANPNLFPNQLGFDHMQSFFVGVAGRPASNVKAEVNFNILGNVADNPINEIFYENVGRPITVGRGADQVILDNNRFRIYNAELEWDTKVGDLTAFHRTGHYHWAYEGDFFNLYREANYGPNLDIYNGDITGVEFQGKGALKNFAAAAGPQVWWGANPTALLKYGTNYKGFNVTGVYNRDFNTDVEFDASGNRVLDANQVASGVIPPLPTERATITVEKEFGKLGVAVGGIWGGNPLNGNTFQNVIGSPGEYVVFNDRVREEDNWGGKVKLTYTGGKFNAYASGSAMGLVANGGSDQTQTFTGWQLKDSGSGNMTNALAGFTYSIGDFQIAPNFMWQQPIVDAIPNDITGPARLRNILVDPFSVRGGNREQTAGELLLTYDPTPGTWYYQWDNDRAEDAKFAANLGFVYRHLPTTQDAHIGFLADRTFFAFPNSAPAEDLWEVNSRIVSKVNRDFGLIANLFTGNGQANGDDTRLIQRSGGDLRLIYKKLKVQNMVRVNDWGPFDYHRDFNLTYPLQLVTDLSANIGKPDWFLLPGTELGVRGTWRSLDEFSPRYLPLATIPNTFPPQFIDQSGLGTNGSEWEIRTYLNINIGK